MTNQPPDANKERATLSLKDKEPRSNRPENMRDEQVRSSEKKTRRSKLDDVDALYVDPAEIPDGFTVEWKRYQIYGKIDSAHLNNMSRDGWEPASPKDFPSLVGAYHKGDLILAGNQEDVVLMIRPKELSEEAKREERINANKQVKDKLVELGMSKPDEAPRDNKGKSLVDVKRTYERLPVGD